MISTNFRMSLNVFVTVYKIKLWKDSVQFVTFSKLSGQTAHRLPGVRSPSGKAHMLLYTVPKRISSVSRTGSTPLVIEHEKGQTMGCSQSKSQVVSGSNSQTKGVAKGMSATASNGKSLMSLRRVSEHFLQPKFHASSTICSVRMPCGRFQFLSVPNIMISFSTTNRNKRCIDYLDAS